jgi:transposase
MSDNDIVQRLRIRWEAMGDMANDQRAEAADEIESLRAELRRVSAVAEEPENLNMQVDALRRRVRELTDRNARLQSQVQESEVREI